MIILYYLLGFPAFFLFMIYMKYLVDKVGVWTNYSDRGFVLCIFLAGLPIFTLLQISIWMGWVK